jgi:hypothetical protein
MAIRVRRRPTGLREGGRVAGRDACMQVCTNADEKRRRGDGNAGTNGSLNPMHEPRP